MLNAPKRFWFHIVGYFFNLEQLFELNVLFCDLLDRGFLRSASSEFGGLR